MGYYFRNFNRIAYDINKNGESQFTTNIINRFRLLEILKEKTTLYTEYTVKESDRPDLIAEAFYGDPTLDWIIFLVNQTVNPQWDFPMNYQNFNRYLAAKYGSVEASTQVIERYEHILQAKQVLVDDTVIPEQVVVVDATTYGALAASDRRLVYAYDHEVDVNEAKRRIKMLQPQFIGKVKDEARRIFQ